ncbi:hypothetical protein [Nostoc sp.]|uniref:hypothetical protein n=1 Tax=Nostoc sp. TaxID=1180 RepID=UPI002FFAE0EF
MSITSYAEDILSDISYDPSVTTEPKLTTDIQPPVNVGTLTDISGCVSIFGPLQICYDLNLSTPSAAITLKVAGITIITGEISPAHPCLTLKGNYSVAKWDLNVCLRVAEKRITLEGSACVTFSGCKSFNITLFHWGNTELLSNVSSTLLTGAFVNDNQPPHHYIVQGLTGNAEANRISLSYQGPVPPQLRLNQTYYLGSHERNFPNAKYLGYDGQYLQFRY